MIGFEVVKGGIFGSAPGGKFVNTALRVPHRFVSPDYCYFVCRHDGYSVFSGTHSWNFTTIERGIISSGRKSSSGKHNVTAIRLLIPSVPRSCTIISEGSRADGKTRKIA